MSAALEQELADYLALRRSLGHKLADTERQLRKFLARLDATGADTVTMEAALGFVLDPDLDPSGSVGAKRLQAVRGFARWLAGVDGRAEVPPAGLVTDGGHAKLPIGGH